MEKFFPDRRVRPVSNVVLLPCQTNLIELNSTASFSVLHGSSSTSNVVLLPCRTQFTNYKYIGIHFKSSLNRVLFFFYFCFPQQLLYSTELNSTPKTSQLRTAVAQRLKQALLAILGLGRTNFSYISVQNLGNPLHEKQLSEKIAGLPFLLMNTLARQACQLSQCETIRAC